MKTQTEALKPSRIAFEHHWVKTRGKRARNDLQRHPAQPETYISDSANRHWVTWQAAQPQEPVQQEPVAWEEIETIANKRYKVVQSHDSMFYLYAVVAGDGTRQVYLGREMECENMARKFAGAFLDGAFAMQNYTTPPQRKPLAYVDLRRVANQCGLGANEVSAQAQAKVDNFARAIEAAHGIKE